MTASNVISFNRNPRTPGAASPEGLIRATALGRHGQDDVFWLKENAEVLSVLCALGRPVAPEALAPYEAFYDGLEERLRFYPQYYRFFLSMCLDLEDLGMPGRKGAALSRWVATVGLAQAELSDLQRAEAMRLLARRGAVAASWPDELTERLHRFIDRSSTFALPNRKAAYELTHIVFYLSDYGRCDPGLSAAARVSLEYAGLIAFLDQDADLLAEVCLGMRFAGQVPSLIWTQTVAEAHAAISPECQNGAPEAADGFHRYLVTGWERSVAGARAFGRPVPEGPVAFVDRAAPQGALRRLSEWLFGLGGARNGHWRDMRDRLVPMLDPQSRDILKRAEQSSSRFADFFAGFARSA